MLCGVVATEIIETVKWGKIDAGLLVDGQEGSKVPSACAYSGQLRRFVIAPTRILNRHATQREYTFESIEVCEVGSRRSREDHGWHQAPKV